MLTHGLAEAYDAKAKAQGGLVQGYEANMNSSQRGGGGSQALGVSDVHVTDKTPLSTLRSHVWRIEERGQAAGAGAQPQEDSSQEQAHVTSLRARLRASAKQLVEMNEAGETAALVALAPPLNESDPKNPKVALSSHVVVCGMPTSIREFMAPLRSKQLNAGKKRVQVRKRKETACVAAVCCACAEPGLARSSQA